MGDVPITRGAPNNMKDTIRGLYRKLNSVIDARWIVALRDMGNRDHPVALPDVI